MCGMRCIYSLSLARADTIAITTQSATQEHGTLQVSVVCLHRWLGARNVDCAKANLNDEVSCPDVKALQFTGRLVRGTLYSCAFIHKCGAKYV